MGVSFNRKAMSEGQSLLVPGASEDNSMDMTICLYAISETSQAAYTSGTESQFVRDDFIRIVYLNNIPEEKTSIEIIFFLFFNYIHYL